MAVAGPGWGSGGPRFSMARCRDYATTRQPLTKVNYPFHGPPLTAVYDPQSSVFGNGGDRVDGKLGRDVPDRAMNTTGWGRKGLQHLAYSLLCARST
jgi:hypothetical protein